MSVRFGNRSKTYLTYPCVHRLPILFLTPRMNLATISFVVPSCLENFDYRLVSLSVLHPASPLAQCIMGIPPQHEEMQRSLIRKYAYVGMTRWGRNVGGRWTVPYQPNTGGRHVCDSETARERTFTALKRYSVNCGRDLSFLHVPYTEYCDCDSRRFRSPYYRIAYNHLDVLEAHI